MVHVLQDNKGGWQRSMSNQDAIGTLQEVYGRIRLCSRMLADHFIPSYLGSLQSALALVSSNYALPDVVAEREQ